MATNNTTATKQTTEKKVTIKLPLTRSEKEDVYVAVNGMPYQIQRGVNVEVPVSVKEVLEHKEEMLAVSMEYEAQASASVDQ